MWGCGSNGRCGLLAFHRGPGGAKWKLKCYVSTPTAVEYFADRGIRVLDFAVGRYWTVAIVRPAP
ncbi:hypothetical protein DIPPA_11595 [Diplonema papillatum]|nr:hypothetical protein DIPPA_11595 [Diplonema papillatum]